VGEWIRSNPKKTGALLFGGAGILAILLLEAGLRLFLGLGDPVLYGWNAAYGYRPLANQDVRRFRGTRIHLNNLGLRTDREWDQAIEGKILFLGDSVTYGGSRISNPELFSTLAVEDLPGYDAGNAGVNAWGIDNIHGLVVYEEFLPASTYVTVVPEIDFHRGLTRLQGLPYWGSKPHLALEELLLHVAYRINLTRYRGLQVPANEPDRDYVVRDATRKLAAMDAFLKSKGYVHLIYISPTRDQVMHGAESDPQVKRSLGEEDLEVVYLGERIEALDLDAEIRGRLFYDRYHLTREGHRTWARMIGQDLQTVLRATP